MHACDRVRAGREKNRTERDEEHECANPLLTDDPRQRGVGSYVQSRVVGGCVGGGDGGWVRTLNGIRSINACKL